MANNEHKLVSYTGTGSALNVEIGFVPKIVRIFQAQSGLEIAKWFDSLTDGYIYLNNLYNTPLEDCGAGIGTTADQVANTAFNCFVNGNVVAVGAVAAGTAPTATTIPQSTYGAFGFEVTEAGVVTAGIDAAANATGYATEALAIAAVKTAALSNTVERTSCFFVTVINTAAAFVGATTNFNATGVTAAYYNFNPNIIATGGVTPLDYDDAVRGIQIGTSAFINESGQTYYVEATR